MSKKEENENLEYTYENQSAWDIFNQNKQEKAFEFSQKYMHFLGKAKTERQVVKEGIKILKNNGFENIENIDSSKYNKKDLNGKKVFLNYRGKNLFASILGKQDLSNGFNLVGSHIDSPRIDLKYKPFYNENGLGLLKTHYYGGIKKYQWVTTPLSIIGVIYDENGNKKHISIGENKNDPNFFLSDLLPHLGKDQLKKKAKKVIEGEKMNLVIGSKYKNDKKDKIKKHLLKIFYEKYGIREQDFRGAELEIVPTQSPKHIGIDKSMIGGYGQDDRICAYSSLQSFINQDRTPKKTSILYWSDKEEIGSVGSTGTQSSALQYFIQKLYNLYNSNFNDLDIKNCLHSSNAISSDVTTMFDPNFKEVYDPKNTALINHGIVISKYTGRGGKYMANDADSEYVQKLKNTFNSKNIPYQFGELGKIDQGGGGTISKFLAHLGINTIDMGPGLLNMHAPMEVSSKLDLYSCYLAYQSFWDLK